MKKKFILLAILSFILFSSCGSRSQQRSRDIEQKNTFSQNNETVNEFVQRDLNHLKRPIIMIAKSFDGKSYTMVVKDGKDSLVSYTGQNAPMIQAIGETFNVNDTICK